MIFCTYIAQAQQNLKLGEAAPNIHVSSWIENIPDNKELNNRFIVLEFWTTWCGPCIGAVPHINELVEEFGKDILFVSLTNEQALRVQRALKRTAFLSAVATDETGYTNKEYGDGKSQYTALPMTVLINDQNIIKWIGSPSDLNSDLLKQFLNGTLAETNLYEDYSLRPHDELDSFTDEMIAIKKLDIPYYFELKVTKNSNDNTILTTNNLYANSNTNLKSFLGTNLNIASNLIEVPKDYDDKNFSIIYKNKGDKNNFISDLIRDVLNRLGLELTTARVKVDGYKTKLSNKTLLEPTLNVNNSSRSDMYDPAKPLVRGVIYKNITIQDLLLDLTKTTGEFLSFEETMEGNFDFTIETGTVANLKRSLESYGITMEKSEIETEKMIYKQI